jgi:hypothetical protein
MSTQALLKAFECGVDYGLLLAEQERAGDVMSDALLCSASGYKYGVPSTPLAPRRVHSQAWFDTMNKSVKSFIGLYAEIAKGDVENA